MFDDEILEDVNDLSDDELWSTNRFKPEYSIEELWNMDWREVINRHPRPYRLIDRLIAIRLGYKLDDCDRDDGTELWITPDGMYSIGITARWHNTSVLEHWSDGDSGRLLKKCSSFVLRKVNGTHYCSIESLPEQQDKKKSIAVCKAWLEWYEYISGNKKRTSV